MAAPKHRVPVKGVYDSCRDCGLPFRPHHSHADDHPGTAHMYKAGRCQACHKHSEGVTNIRKRRRPDNCKHCDCLLRPSGRQEWEYPGTREHRGHGVCTTCDTRIRRGQTPGEDWIVARDPEADAKNAVNHARYQQKRAERLRRQEQMRRLRIGQEAARARFIAMRNAA